MIDEPSVARKPLVSRADIALLTLRLRALRHDADQAEAAASASDPEVARQQLLVRLEPMVDERRRMLEQQLDEARAEAASMVDEAHREAEAILAEARARVEAVRRTPDVAVEPVAVEPVAVEPVAVEPVAVLEEPGAHRVEDPIVSDPGGPVVAPVEVVIAAAEQRDDVAPSPWSLDPRPEVVVLPIPSTPVPPPQLPGVPPSTTAPGPASNHAVIDAEAFAQVFGTVVAAMMREGGPRHEPPAAQKKTSFLSSARHLDVMLMGITMAIALVILAAWLV